MTAVVGRALDAPRPSRAARMLRRGLALTPLWLLLLAISFSTLYPLVFVLLTSLRTVDDYQSNPLALPAEVTLDNLVDAWTRAGVGEYALNSLVVVGSAVILGLVIACLAGFAFAHLPFPLKKPTFGVILILMILPGTVLLVPVFSIVNMLGLLNNYVGLILVYTGLTLPFGLYMMTAYFKQVPPELFEAARIDGASILRIFWSVALPLARPAILTLVLLNFLWHWNELLFASVILNDGSKRVLSVGLTFLQGENLTSVPLLAAGLFISMVPVLFALLAFQRNLTQGITAGALK